MHTEDLSSLITFHRKQAGLTQIKLAECAGVSRTVIQDLEAARGRTSWKHLLAVLHVLNISLKPRGPLVEQWENSRKEAE